MRFLVIHISMLLALLVILAEYSEARVPIAVIDTGIRKTASIKPYLCKNEVDLLGYGIHDVHGHGTNVAHILARYISPKTHCLLIIKWYHNAEVEQSMATSVAGILKQGRIAVKALKAVERYRAKYVNMSSAGTLSHWKERYLMLDLLRNGVVFAVAAGNEGLDLSVSCDSFPACYNFSSPNFYVIGGSHLGRKLTRFNHGGPVDTYEQAINVRAGGITLSGTSQATPIFLGKYISERIGRAPGTIRWRRK